MLRLKKIFLFAIIVIMVSALFGCEDFRPPKTESGEKTLTIVFDMSAYDGEITVSEDVTDYENKVKVITVTTTALTLEAVLDELATDKKVTYSGTKTSGSLFVEVIDNITPAANSYFLIFSDDTDNVNSAWGTYAYEDVTYSSTASGITVLPVKDGKTYIFTIIAY